MNLHLDGRIASRVKDFTRTHISNNGHMYTSYPIDIVIICEYSVIMNLFFLSQIYAELKRFRVQGLGEI